MCYILSKSERLFYICRISNFFADIQMITKVLLIDDDPDGHEIFSPALKKYSSKITCVIKWFGKAVSY
jgi:hypothetical protein